MPTIATHIESAFHAARQARLQGRCPIDDLRGAVALCADLDPESPLHARALWKLSKAECDLTGVIDLSRLVQASDRGVPVFAGPHRVRAARALRWSQDRNGYGDPALVQAWSRLATAERGGKPSLDLAWCHLCRDELEAMHEALEPVEDAVGAAYTALCAANWSGDPSHGDPAELSEANAPHLVHALLEHALRFGSTVVVDLHHHDPYADALRNGSGFDVAMTSFSAPELRLAVWQSARCAGVAIDRPPLLGCEIFARGSADPAVVV